MKKVNEKEKEKEKADVLFKGVPSSREMNCCRLALMVCYIFRFSQTNVNRKW